MRVLPRKKEKSVRKTRSLPSRPDGPRHARASSSPPPSGHQSSPVRAPLLPPPARNELLGAACSEMDVRGAGEGPRHPKPGEARRRRRRQSQDGGRWHRGAGGTHRDGCCVRGRRWKGRGVRGAGPLPGCRAPPLVRTRELPEAASAVPERLAAPAAPAAANPGRPEAAREWEPACLSRNDQLRAWSGPLETRYVFIFSVSRRLI